LSLVNRLTRLDKELIQQEQHKYLENSDGMTLRVMVQRLLDVFNADAVEEHV